MPEPNGACSFEISTSRASRGQGSLGLLDRVDPCHDDRSSQQIYPDLDNSSTPCHETVVRLFRKIEVTNRPCGVGPISERFRQDEPAETNPPF